MIFIGLLAIAAIVLLVAFASEIYEMIFASFIFLAVACLVAGLAPIPSGQQHIIWTKPVSNVKGYENPNGGTVVSFDMEGRHVAMDEGGDDVTVEISSNSQVLVKQCQYGAGHLWIPWDADSYCSYVLRTPAVN